MTLRKEGGVDGHPIDCCPMVEEMSEPVGGRNRDNMYVELYRNGDNVQRFFEYSCKSDVLDKPCRFVDWRLSNQSRCVQKFSYTYAIVENPEWKVRRGGRDVLSRFYRDDVSLFSFLFFFLFFFFFFFFC